MKKNYLFKLILLAIPVLSFVLMSSNVGQNGAYSGSPGDSGNTCAACHSGGNFGASVSISTNIPVTGYELNTPYDITVTINESGASRHGFALTAERDANNSKAGTFTATSSTKLVNGNGNITQSDADNGNTWTFTWTSPSTDVGNVSFYASGNAANGNGGTSGDQIVTSSITSPSLGVSEAKKLEFSMFPNPSTDRLTIKLPSGTFEAEVGVFDYTGRKIRAEKLSSNNQQLDVSELATGMYIVRILSDGRVGVQTLIVQ